MHCRRKTNDRPLDSLTIVPCMGTGGWTLWRNLHLSVRLALIMIEEWQTCKHSSSNPRPDSWVDNSLLMPTHALQSACL